MYVSMYITVKEFKNAPTGIDTYSIIPNGSQEQNDAELYNIITRASAWIDEICQVNTLEATTTTEFKEMTMNSSGIIRVHPDNVPIVQIVDSVQYRVTPASGWIPLSINYIQAFERYFTIYNLSEMTVSPALAQMFPSVGYATPYRMRSLQKIPLTLQYTYINGFTNTLLKGGSSAGATSVNLVDATGAIVGQTLTIYEDDKTERFTVDSVAGDVLTTTKPLLFDHSNGVGVSALPASIKQACILLSAYFIKERGALAVTMNETSLQGVSRYKDAADIDTAKELLKKYKRGIIS